MLIHDDLGEFVHLEPCCLLRGGVVRRAGERIAQARDYSFFFALNVPLTSNGFTLTSPVRLVADSNVPE